MRRSTPRSAALFALVALGLAVTAPGGSAAIPARTRILGVVPHTTGLRALAPHVRRKALDAAPSALTFDASYERLIDQYLSDVAADSGGTQNVYSVATQYGDGSGNVQYRSTFGGSYVDNAPLPPSGCSVAPYCLTDQQLEEEIQRVLTAKGWQGGLDHLFFLMTPLGVASCEDASGTACSTNVFCAYHSVFGTSVADAVVYADEPYLGPSHDCADPSSQGFPNDVDSDTTINTISHEQNEAISDPFGDAWIAADGAEMADLCAYGFGTQLGGSPGTDAYNQVINGHHYDLQQEYSNTDGGCVQSLGGPPTPPPSGDGSGPLLWGGGPVMHTNTTYAIYWLPTPGGLASPIVTGTAAVNQTLTTSAGSWNGSPTSYAYQWQRCPSATAGCVDIPGATGASYELTTADGGAYVRSTVSARNVNGPSPYSQSASELVVPFPYVVKAPRVSGRVRIGRRLSASTGAWSGAPTAYRFQWLRCNGRGSRCARIRQATHASYRLGKHDAKHRLRVRVTALNLAGSTLATSKATGRVPAARRKRH